MCFHCWSCGVSILGKSTEPMSHPYHFDAIADHTDAIKLMGSLSDVEFVNFIRESREKKWDWWNLTEWWRHVELELRMRELKRPGNSFPPGLS